MATHRASGFRHGIYFSRRYHSSTSKNSDERGPWVGEDDFGPGDPQPATGKYFAVGSAPAVNVIFYVPGSVLTYSDLLGQMEAARFSRKQKLLLVAVPVPPEMINSPVATIRPHPRTPNSLQNNLGKLIHDHRKPSSPKL